MPYKLTKTNIETPLMACNSLRPKRKKLQKMAFLHPIVTGNEKLNYYHNPNRKKTLNSSKEIIHINSKSKHSWK